MSMRQIRLTTREQIQNGLKAVTGKKINIVLCDRQVLFGELHKVDAKELSFVNMRLEPVSLPLEAISEVYFDVR